MSSQLQRASGDKASQKLERVPFLYMYILVRVLVSPFDDKPALSTGFERSESVGRSLCNTIIPLSKKALVGTPTHSLIHGTSPPLSPQPNTTWVVGWSFEKLP